MLDCVTPLATNPSGLEGRVLSLGDDGEDEGDEGDDGVGESGGGSGQLPVPPFTATFCDRFRLLS
jgi:hypothetical protein